MSSHSKENETNSKPPETREETEGPHPAELVTDGNGGYEEQQTGIELSYVLKEDEIYECLKRSSFLRTNGRVFAFEIAGLAVLAVVFLVIGITTYRSLFYFYAASCATLIVVLGVFPYQNNKARAHSSADGHTIRMAVYPDRIQLGRGTKRWDVPLDGTAECAQFENMIVLYVPERNDPKRRVGQRMIVLPLRCVGPRVLPEVQAMIVAGTRPKKIPR